MNRKTQTAKRVGIDAGSKTIKVVVLDEDDSILYSAYRRHRSNIRDTLRDLIHDVVWINGDMEASVSVTGSAGINVAKLLGVPFTQEVVATTEAVKRTIPDADAIIELGGEDAKVVYLTGGVEQRMNATCAGGTGGFIDTIAFMLGTRTSSMSNLAMGAQRIYPIASRCAVFAQTDIRPLLNEGASKSDIAASALDAVVRQTLGGLACGRPLKGNVVFLGGPFQYIPELVNRFRKALDLDHQSGVKPPDAHLYPALGAAFMSAKANEGGEGTVRLGHLEALLADEGLQLDAEGLPRLEPLFSSPEELARFQERHGAAVFPKKRAFDAEGPVYVGIDSGSTTVKLALIDADGNLLHDDYRPSRGDTLGTVREMLGSLYRALPKSVLAGRERPYIAQAVATGYGERMLIEGFGVDAGVVETTAHVRAARYFEPEASFVLDIGGQDMKALWLNGPYTSDAVLNEACSSGCGAFLEGTAHGLHTNPTSFAAAALEATSPVDLGTRCTVFMSSRVKHAQKVGASVADIAAGAAYSVVNNALFRIIGAERASELGEHVVVQGGTFKSDAVLRAFEKICGIEVIRPDKAHLMGAIGAALVARDRAQQKGGPLTSTLVTQEQLDAMDPKRQVRVCEGCANACRLGVLDMGEGRLLVSGNRCEKGRALLEETSQEGERKSSRRLPNLIRQEQALCAQPPKPVEGPDGIPTQRHDRSSVAVGIVDGLELYRYVPFWRGLMEHLGFTVSTPRDSGTESDGSGEGSGGACGSESCSRAWETVPAESACYPAKLVHAKAFELKEAGADALLFPRFERRNHCAVACEYAHALRDSVDWLRDGSVTLLDPVLSSVRPRTIAGTPENASALEDALQPLCRQAGLPLEAGELEEALEAGLGRQRAFEEALAQRTDEALEALEADPSAHGILLVGRPYHVDAAVMHGIDGMLTELGFTVLGMTGLGRHARGLDHREEGLPEWRPAKRLMKAAQFVVDHPRIDLVCLQSFGCGYDAASLEDVRELLEAHGRPFTTLKIDEMVETAHIRIRLRTLAESIQGKRLQGEGGHTEGEEDDGSGLGTGNQKQERPSRVKGEAAKRVRILKEPLSDEDLAVARVCTVKDACFTANVLAARIVRLLREDPAIEVVEVPKPCKECLCDAIPRMVERATGLLLEFVWLEGAGVLGPSQGSSGSQDPSAAEASSGGSLGAVGERACGEERIFSGERACGGDRLRGEERPKVGILGNPLLVFEPYMNDGLVELLDELGCEAVLPEEEALYTEDVQYLDQLERFARQGVRHVIYLQSFGCVKGHVHARGSHYAFAEAFPDMPVTVLDYDPEASALNRENRIRLIAESVLSQS